jgi:hypothetical protein
MSAVARLAQGRGQTERPTEFRHKNALPLSVTHRWSGSIIEQLKIVDPLTNPTGEKGAHIVH